MRKFTFSFKTLLLAAGLVMSSVSAWGETKTLYPTGSTDPTSTSAWQYHANITATQNTGYISFVHSQARYGRSCYLNFYTTGSDIYSTYDTYTVSFDFLNTNCWSNGYSSTPEIVLYGEGASFPNPLYSTFASANTSKKNYLLYLSNTGTWVNSFYVNGADENPAGAFTKNAWYTVSITVTKKTGNVTYKITPQGSSTPVTNGSGSYTADSEETSFNCQGIFLTFGSSYTVQIANVKVTTEVVVAETTSAGLGFATLYTGYPLNFAGATPAGLKAYTATVSESTVTLTEVKNVPANTGVVLKGTAGTTYSIPVIASSETAKGSLLGSATETTAYDAVTNMYGLAVQGSEVQFSPVTSGSVAAGKAYLNVPTSSRVLNVVFEDEEATGIAAPEVVEAEEDGVIYNLSGQIVSSDYKGIVIKNGKKYFNK